MDDWQLLRYNCHLAFGLVIPELAEAEDACCTKQPSGLLFTSFFQTNDTLSHFISKFKDFENFFSFCVNDIKLELYLNIFLPT